MAAPPPNVTGFSQTVEMYPDLFMITVSHTVQHTTPASLCDPTEDVNSLYLLNISTVCGNFQLNALSV